MELLRSQKNELFRMIEEHGLDPSDFDYTEHTSFLGHFSTVIRFKPEIDFHFDIQGVDINVFTCKPWENQAYFEGRVKDWSDLVYQFRIWLESVISEHNEDDLWSEIKTANLDFGTNPKDTKSKFSEEEKNQIHARIDQLKSEISNLGITSEQLKIIETKLDTLREKMDDLSQFDWKSLAIGTVINIATSILLPPDQGKAFLSLVSQIFRNLLQLP